MEDVDGCGRRLRDDECLCNPRILPATQVKR